jgi:hypothetical protein
MAPGGPERLRETVGGGLAPKLVGTLLVEVESGPGIAVGKHVIAPRERSSLLTTTLRGKASPAHGDGA